jgi:hypothetical protein
MPARTRKPLLPPNLQTPEAAAFIGGAEPATPAAAPPPAPAPPDAEPEARVRFTVDLPRSLHKRLKLAALNRDEAMTDLARQAMADWLDANG